MMRIFNKHLSASLFMLAAFSTSLYAQEAFDFTELPPAMEGQVYEPFELTFSNSDPTKDYEIVVTGLPEDPNNPGVTGGIIKNIFKDDKDTLTPDDDIKKVFIQTKKQAAGSNFLPVVKVGLGGQTFNINLVLKEEVGISTLTKDDITLPLVIHKPVSLVPATTVSTLSPHLTPPPTSTPPAGTSIASLESGNYTSIQFDAVDGYVRPNGRYTYSIVSGNLPPGLVLNAATGAIEGTPEVVGNHPGTYDAIGNAILGEPVIFDFEISVMDQWETPTSDSGLFSIEVTDSDPGPLPFIFLAPEMLAESQIGKPYNTEIRAFGGLLPYTWDISGLPTGLNYSTSLGTISGTPATGSEGTHVIKISVHDSQVPTQNYTTFAALRVVPEGMLPLSIQNNFLAVGYENQSYSFQLQAIGGASSNHQWSVRGLPGGLSLDGDTIVGTCADSSASTYTVELVVENDAEESDSVILKLLVLPSEESSLADTSQELPRLNLLDSAAPAGCSMRAQGKTPTFMLLLFTLVGAGFACRSWYDRRRGIESVRSHANDNT